MVHYNASSQANSGFVDNQRLSRSDSPLWFSKLNVASCFINVLNSACRVFLAVPRFSSKNPFSGWVGIRYPVEIFSVNFRTLKEVVIVSLDHCKRVSSHILFGDIPRKTVSTDSQSLPLTDCVKHQSSMFSDRISLCRHDVPWLIW